MHGGSGRSSDHVRGARSDRSCTGESGKSVSVFSKGRSDMHHSLLILRAVESKAFLCSDLDNSLAEPTNIAVSKNTPEALYEPVLATIPFYVLPGNKADQRLSNCKTNRPVHTSVHQRKSSLCRVAHGLSLAIRIRGKPQSRVFRITF